MSTGEGIVLSTILVLLFLAIFFTLRWISNRHLWLFVACLLGGCSVLVGVGMWGWHMYQERPENQGKMYELEKIRLGMSPLEVKLQRGEPIELPRELGQSRRWQYGETEITFSRNNETTMEVWLICASNTYTEALTLGTYDSEERLLAKLGPWPHESINASGLSRLVSYPHWNVGYELTKGSITAVCVYDAEGKTFLTYSEEYDRKFRF